MDKSMVEFTSMGINFLSYKLRTKVLGLIVIMILGSAFFAVVSLNTLDTVKVNGPLYKQIVDSKDLIADILPPPEYLIESYLVVLQMLEEQDEGKLNALVQKSAKLREEYETRHQFWDKTLGPGPLRDTMIVRSYEPAKQFLDLRDREFIPAIQKKRPEDSPRTCAR
jgi:methyl-accepting chemotaxis protein